MWSGFGSQSEAESPQRGLHKLLCCFTEEAASFDIA
jgi:hypothetical protein